MKTFNEWLHNESIYPNPPERSLAKNLNNEQLAMWRSSHLLGPALSDWRKEARDIMIRASKDLNDMMHTHAGTTSQSSQVDMARAVYRIADELRDFANQPLPAVNKL
jgi:hypothetical protein